MLVTSLSDPILTVAQHYRDRADAENNFDELKNPWGWGGYTTRDIKRCQIMARMAIPQRRAEAITSRPLLLEGVGKRTRHAGQTTVTIVNQHGKAKQAVGFFGS